MGKIIDTGIGTAEGNMRIDSDLLAGLLHATEPILHLYDWEGTCATYGYFIKPYDLLNADAIQTQKIQIARRPTGGGIVFHHCDFAFSFLIPTTYRSFPNTLESYAFINQIVIHVVRKFCANDHSLPLLLPSEDSCEENSDCRHFCMAKPTIYDVMIEGKKVGGAAQRRTRDGFLHQGTISLTIPSQHFLQTILRSGNPIINAMQDNSYPLLGKETVTSEALSIARQHLRKLFSEALIKYL